MHTTFINMNGSAPNAPARSSVDAPTYTTSKPIDIPALSKAQRTGSYSSDASSTLAGSPSLSSSFPASLRKSSTFVKPAQTVNVHTTCGRHTDQYFFGGPSLRELARSMLGKKE
ncbi:seleno domain [Purpureocillium lavendulum]|uniref:Seleno domain n=1 Tax=Purpureocillium lavendulum TaxID=1247861 RepID=A0AB34G4M7_9HYPO|nr:seleno domain [Purpureocillium lavendulum]